MENNILVKGIVLDKIDWILLEEIRNFAMSHNVFNCDINIKNESDEIQIKFLVWSNSYININISLNNDCWINANSILYGPGYHVYIINIIEDFINKFLVDFQVQDKTNYYYDEDFDKLKFYFLAHAKEFLEKSKRFAKRYKKLSFNTDQDFSFILKDSEISTLMGIKNIDFFYDKNFEVKPFSLYDVYPWVDKFHTLNNAINKIKFQLWNYWRESKSKNYNERLAKSEIAHFTEEILFNPEWSKQVKSLPKLAYENCKNEKWERANNFILSKYEEWDKNNSYNFRSKLVKLGKLNMPIINYYGKYETNKNYFLAHGDKESKKCNPFIKIINWKLHDFILLQKDKFIDYKTIDLEETHDFNFIVKYKKIWTNRYAIIIFFKYRNYCYTYEMQNTSKKMILKEYSTIKDNLFYLFH